MTCTGYLVVVEPLIAEDRGLDNWSSNADSFGLLAGIDPSRTIVMTLTIFDGLLALLLKMQGNWIESSPLAWQESCSTTTHPGWEACLWISHSKN